MAGTKRQYGAIDIARYVSALLVVAIHVYPFVDKFLLEWWWGQRL